MLIIEELCKQVNYQRHDTICIPLTARGKTASIYKGALHLVCNVWITRTAKSLHMT